MRWTTPAHTVLAAGVAAAASLAAVVAAAPAATAATTTTVDYACTSPLGPSTMSVDFESPYLDPPEVSVITLSSRHDGRGTVRLKGALPGAIAQEAVQRGATSMYVGGHVDLTKDYDPTGGAPSLVGGADVPLGDQAGPTDVAFQQAAVHWIVEPGLREIRVGTASFAVRFHDADGALVWGPVALTCTVPAPAVIDTIWLRSESEVQLTMGNQSPEVPHPIFAYGEPVPVEAQVRVRGSRAAAGWVDFSLGGVTQRVALDDRGTARATFPGPVDRTATNPVISTTNFITAAYVPADSRYFRATASYPALVPVTFATTEPRVRITGTDADRRTRVKVRVEPAFESSPSGTVRVNLRRLGSRGHWSKTKAIGSRSRAVAGFGKLPRGRYKVVVKYRGDDNHLGSRTVRTFRVRR